MARPACSRPRRSPSRLHATSRNTARRSLRPANGLNGKIRIRLTLDALSSQLGRTPTGQAILLAGLLAPANLLDLVRNFIMFETVDGRRVKKLARYQQFIAAGKAIERIRTALNAQRRGGVIHHTQGSGKSLTMVFLATELRRLPEAENPTLVIVTDRTDLDDQITSQFKRSGFRVPI